MLASPHVYRPYKTDHSFSAHPILKPCIHASFLSHLQHWSASPCSSPYAIAEKNPDNNEQSCPANHFIRPSLELSCFAPNVALVPFVSNKSYALASWGSKSYMFRIQAGAILVGGGGGRRPLPHLTLWQRTCLLIYILSLVLSHPSYYT